jgi:hypothetical protein
VFLLHLHHYIHRALEPLTPRNVLLRQAGLITVIIILLTSANTHDLRHANLFNVTKTLVRHIPQQYSAELDARYKQIMTAKQDTVRLPPLQSAKDNVIFFDRPDIVPKPTQTQGIYARYWGAKLVLLDTGKQTDTQFRPRPQQNR